MANGLSRCRDPKTTETEIFVRQFDQFFDCLNVRNRDEHFKRRKPHLRPYTSPNDYRLKVFGVMLKLLYTFMYIITYTVARSGISGVPESMEGQCDF